MTLQPGVRLSIARTPLTRGLVLAGYGSAANFDCVASPWTNNSAVFDLTLSGKTWRFNGSSTYLSRSDSLVNGAGGNFSMACICTPRALVSQARLFSFGGTSGGQSFTAFKVNGTTSSADFEVRNDAASTSTATVASTFVVGSEVLLIGVANSMTPTLYTKTSSTTGPTHSGVITTSRTGLGCLVRAGQGNFAQFDISFWAAWNRSLSLMEVAALRLNPWQIFASPPARIYVAKFFNIVPPAYRHYQNMRAA